MESRMTALTIGQVADAADVNIQTIRYYERRGLFPTPRRTPAGYRQYADDAVARLRFIKHAQELGFSLQEIQELLGLRVRHSAACDVVERKTRQKIEVVQQRIRDLQRMRRTLKIRSEEHTSELQSPCNLVCRLLLEKKKKIITDR